MVNKTAINNLAKQIRASRTFNMAQVTNPCGTPGCIAGHLFNDNQGMRGSEDVHRMAKLLKIDVPTANLLYSGWFSSESLMDHITADEAAETLEAIARGEFVENKKAFNGIRILSGEMDRAYNYMVAVAEEEDKRIDGIDDKIMKSIKDIVEGKVTIEINDDDLREEMELFDRSNHEAAEEMIHETLHNLGN